MFLSWRSDLVFSDYPFIVIGSGPAGLSLAGRLSAHGKVLVVEAGNADNTLDAGDDIYQIVSTGRDYPTTGTRLTAFGGTSNHWAGHGRPLTRGLFDREGPGRWPIRYDDFAPHIADACKFLNFAPFDDDGDTPAILSGVLAGHEHLKATWFHHSSPIVRLGSPDFVAQYGANPGIDILTDTRLMEIELAAGGSRVEAISILNRPSRETARVPVRQLFLCTGGIENARMLLWAGRNYPAGNPLVGGPNGLTGKTFSDKHSFNPVEVFFDRRAHVTETQENGPVDTCWELSEDLLSAHDLPRFGVFPLAEVPFDSSAMERASSMYALAAPTYFKVDAAFQMEQPANEGSYLKLSGARDADGVARPELHWDIRPRDIEAYKRAVMIFCGVLSQSGYVRCRINPHYRTEDWSNVYLGQCNHPVGTTRMGETKQDGVVDRDCRVFGLDNLFVAGSSVFPSSDYVNPTLSIVALAGRLADHVIKGGVQS
jgi:hypothetical protein